MSPSKAMICRKPVTAAFAAGDLFTLAGCPGHRAPDTVQANPGQPYIAEEKSLARKPDRRIALRTRYQHSCAGDDETNNNQQVPRK